MKHRTLKLTTLAAAVSLACGMAAAQQGAGEEGIGVEPGVGPSEQIEAGESGLEREEQIALGSEQDESHQGADEEHDLAAADDASGDETDSGSSVAGNSQQLDGIVEEHEDLGKFVEAVKAAGLEESLTSDTEYTVFAPTDDAFDELPEDWMAPENREQLVSMLRAHIVADDVDQEMAKTLGSAQTIDGGSIELSAEEDELMVGDAKVVQSDIQAGSLRIHAIDKVLESDPDSGEVDVATLDQERSSETESDIGVGEPEVQVDQPDLGGSNEPADDLGGLDDPAAGDELGADEPADETQTRPQDPILR